VIVAVTQLIVINSLWYGKMEIGSVEFNPHSKGAISNLFETKELHTY
jgi:hypothetical protein